VRACEKKIEEGKLRRDDKEKIAFKQRLSSRSCKDDLKRWNDKKEGGRKSGSRLFEIVNFHQRINLWFTNYWYLIQWM